MPTCTRLAASYKYPMNILCIIHVEPRGRGEIGDWKINLETACTENNGTRSKSFLIFEINLRKVGNISVLRSIRRKQNYTVHFVLLGRTRVFRMHYDRLVVVSCCGPFQNALWLFQTPTLSRRGRPRHTRCAPCLAPSTAATVAR